MTKIKKPNEECFKMRVFIILLISLMWIQPANASALNPKASLIALYFSAQWCPNCHVLSPILEEARAKGKLDDKDILFITLDLTNKTTIHQSLMLAEALGVRDFVKAQGSSTGYIAVLDGATHKELTHFDRTVTADGIIKAITEKLPK
jgi:thiol-disulfide isomerase/thioredoxin